MVDAKWLAQLAGKASSLTDRLNGRFVRLEEQGNEKQIEQRLERWRDRVAKGDKQKWAARLALSGLDEEQVRQALQPHQPAKSSPLPAWTETLAEVIAVARRLTNDELQQPPTTPTEEHDRNDRQAQPLTRFPEFVAPFLKVARENLRRLAADETLAILSREAQLALEAELLGRLSNLCWQTIHWEFSIYRSTRRSSIFYRYTPEGQQPATDLYTSFVDRHLSDGLVGLFEQYPVLARLMTTCVRLWTEAVSEFVGRLHSDLPRLRSVFASSEPGKLGHVAEIRAGLSDPHNGGRMAAIVTFDSGIRLVYKPRDLGLERAWFGFVEWLNDHHSPEQFKVLEVLDLGTHGWVEFVTHEPAADVEAAEAYYRRVGATLALLHVMEGADFHQENIIAHGAHPVLVDLEMILHHRMPLPDSEQGAQADFLAREMLLNSVVRSGLLPQWAIDRAGEAIDMSGLASLEGSKMPETPRLQHANTDSVDIIYKRHDQAGGANELLLEGQVQEATDYVDELIAGFERMYDYLTKQRETIVAAGGPLTDMHGQSVRFVYRPTRLYGQLLNYALQPRYLRDGADRSIELDMLSGQFVLTDDKQRQVFWPLLQREIESLEQLDVPIFHARSDSKDLQLDDGQTIGGCFREASDDLVRTRIRQLSNDECRQQCIMIRSSLYARTARHAETAAESGEMHPDEVEPLRAAEALAAAVAIGDELCERALVADDGSASWLGLEFIPTSERWQLQPLGRELYGGTCGVALFLATLYRASRVERFRELALASLVSLRKMLHAPDAATNLDPQMGIGGAAGLASYSHTLGRIGMLLGEEEFIEDARRAAALLQPELIAKDEGLDVISGSAGAILGLLSWSGRGDGSDVINTAIACGERLLKKRTESKEGPRAWKTMPDVDRPLTGFSHGAAGNAYALLRLFEATADARFKEAAEEAMHYERALFSASHGNWPDLRDVGEDVGGFMTAWCHGAPGIGLARLGSLHILDTPEVRQEINVAIESTLACPLGGRDHLCCGTMGRTDVLLSFARRLNRPHIEELARRQAAWTVRRARRHGYRILDIEAQDAFVPGMFQGLSGIGYSLLRLADPDVPSVLLWE